MSYNQFSILSCSFKSEQNQASLFLTIPLGHCDLCNFFISEMKSPSSTIVQKKETQFMCNSDGSSSTVSLCYVDENERKCMETVTDNEEDFPFGHFQRCCISYFIQKFSEQRQSRIILLMNRFYFLFIQ